MVDGIIPINKAVGTSSFRVVSKIKKFLSVNKAGHGGTLDPLASGVLLVFVGRATKFSKYALDCSKEYLCKITFGYSMNTFDLEGEITGEKKIPDLSLDLINHHLSQYIGEIKQTPPIHSAIKIKGKPAYHYARKNIDITMNPRKVRIYDISIIEWNGLDLILKISTSKGFYVRSFADEIGKVFDSLSYLSGLSRTKVGIFKQSESIDLDNLFNLDLKEANLNNIISSPDKLLQDFDAIQIASDLIDKFVEKKPFCVKDLKKHSNYRVYDNQNNFLGTASFSNSNNTLIRNELYKINNSL